MSTGTITLPLTATPVVIENGLTPYTGKAINGALLFVNDSSFVDTTDELYFQDDTLTVSNTINSQYLNGSYISGILSMTDNQGDIVISCDSGNRSFYDQNQNPFMDGNQRIIYDSVQNESIDANSRLLTPGGQANTLSWGNGIEITDENGNPLADFLDSSGVVLYGLLTLANGGIQMPTVGKGIALKGGSNARIGTLTLNGTTAVVVANTTVTANTRIMLTTQTAAGTVGAPYVSTRVNGTSFSVKSTAVGDTSTCGYVLFEQT